MKEFKYISNLSISNILNTKETLAIQVTYVVPVSYTVYLTQLEMSLA